MSLNNLPDLDLLPCGHDASWRMPGLVAPRLKGKCAICWKHQQKEVAEEGRIRFTWVRQTEGFIEYWTTYDYPWDDFL